MSNFGPKEVNNLLGLLEPIRDQFVQKKNELKRIYPNVNPDRDARITAYSKLINACNSLQLSLVFMSNYLMKSSWWDSIGKERLTDRDKKLYIAGFESTLKMGFIQLYFSSVESSFRIYLRNIAPGACSNATAEFKTIYDSLLRSHLSSCPTEGVELLDLWRLVRNTIHNNGVYFHKNGQNAKVQWKGAEYFFGYGKAVDFITWEFLMVICESIGELVFAIVNDSVLLAIQSELVDPYAER
jgi:hypothetical protein